jgi:hypothetical protein
MGNKIKFSLISSSLTKLIDIICKFLKMLYPVKRTVDISTTGQLKN